MKIAGSILIALLAASFASAMSCRCKDPRNPEACDNGTQKCDNAKYFDNKHCITTSFPTSLCFGQPDLDWLTPRYGFNVSDIPTNGSYVCVMSIDTQYGWFCVCKGELCNYDMTLADVNKWIWPTTTSTTSTLTTSEITTSERITNNAAGRPSMTVINDLMLIAMVCSRLGLHQLMFY